MSLPFVFSIDYKKACYLCFDVPDEYRPHVYHPSKYPFGSFIAEFLSIDFEQLKQDLKSKLEDINKNWGNTYEIEKIINIHCGKIMSNLIGNDIYKSMTIGHNLPTYERFLDSISLATSSYISLQMDLKEYLTSRHISEDSWMSNFVYGFGEQIKVSFTFTDTLCLEYSLSDVFSLINLDYVHVLNNDVLIKMCENCKKYFIPQNRSDEIYCNRIYNNGKSCKEIGYENKLKSNPFKAEYRKAYKTQHAKIKRNLKNIPNYKEKYFDPWVFAAKEAMEKYQKQNDINGFIQWIKEH